MSNKELIKQLVEANSNIEMAIKQKGEVSTKNFVAVVKLGERQYVVGKKEFEVKFGHQWLVKNDLLRTSSFQQVVVVEKKKVS